MASPQIAGIIATIRNAPRVPLTRAVVPFARAAMEEASPRTPSWVTRVPIEQEGVRGEWLTSEGTDPDRRIVYLHGGGYFSGSPATHRALVSWIGRMAGMAVFSVDYRLAPEHPFPAAIEDATSALDWARGHGPGGEAEAGRLFVAGDSAGGGLTLASLLALRDKGRPLPDGAVTLSAWTDLAGTGESVRSRAAVEPMFTPDQALAAASLYLGDRPGDDPLASPLYADPTGLPPLLMQVGDAEILLDDSVRLAEKAKAAGVDVTLEVWPEMIHVFQMFGAILPEGKHAIEHIGRWLRARA